MRRRALLGAMTAAFATGGAGRLADVAAGWPAGSKDSGPEPDTTATPDEDALGDLSKSTPLTRYYSVPRPDDVARLRVRVPCSLYDHYAERPRQADYLAYATDPGNATVVESVAESLRSIVGLNADRRSLLDAAVGFVRNMDYVFDEKIGYAEYPKYPVETLVEGEGDCEDTSALLAAVLAQLGFDVALLALWDADHMAVGLRDDGLELGGTFYTREEERYFYLETVEPGWAIGDVPSNYKKQVAEVLPLAARQHDS